MIHTVPLAQLKIAAVNASMDMSFLQQLAIAL
jgi:hypothetical protein